MLFPFYSIFRHLTELGLKIQDPGLKKIVRMLMASSYLPEEQSLPMFIQLFKEPDVKQKISQYPEMTKFFRYFHKTWILTFAPKMWNVMHRPARLRTTNFCAGWNSVWNRKIQRNSPSLCLAIQFLKQQEKIVDNQLELIRIGHPVPKQNPKLRLFNEKVQALKTL